MGLLTGCTPGDANACPAGEKCTAYVEEIGACCVDTNICVPIIGDVQYGQACTRTEMNDDCANTLFCMPSPSSGSTGPGVCLQFCDVSDPGSCGSAGLPTAQCISFNDGVLPVCQDDCDPIMQNCGSGLGCYGAGLQGFSCSPPGAPPGGDDGDDCFTIQSCLPGLMCASATVQNGCTSSQCCTPFCDLNTGTGCLDPFEECVPYFEPGTQIPGYENVGHCGLP
jgi:hypothetical protein